VFHEGGGSPQSTAKRVLRHHANRWKLLEKHGSLTTPSLIKPILAARHTAELFLLSIAWLSSNRPQRAIKNERIRCRLALLRLVWTGYRTR
jgi:hypothetical protein